MTKTRSEAIDTSRLNVLSGRVHCLQVAGTPATPFVIHRGPHGEIAVGFQYGFQVCFDETEGAQAQAKALADRLNAALRPLVTPHLDAMLAEIESIASTPRPKDKP
jgi:hypothetical protein